MALTYTPAIDTHFQCPDFNLLGVDGKKHNRAEFEGTSALLVMFICNHCPYVKAIEERLVQLGEFMKSKNLQVVAICANDAENYPEDSFEKMKEKAEQRKYPFPYLHDSTQEIAKAFDAVCTPDFFLFDKNLKLAYRGRLDDSWKEADKVTQEELKTAVLALIENKPNNPHQQPSMGCNIKWIKP
ncbi:MAG: hypothetical protein RJB66_1835 [Pseudomonadota bacterium]